MLKTVGTDSLLLILGSGDRSMVKRWARVRKVPVRVPAGAAGDFSSLG